MKSLVLLFLFSTVQLCRSANLYEKDPSTFCGFVPTGSELTQQRSKCPTCQTFTSTLEKMRSCCDHSSDSSKVSCLDELRAQEMLLADLFMTWFEGQDKDRGYVSNLEQCASSYKNLQLKFSGCANKRHTYCVDPVGFLLTNCSDKKYDEDCVKLVNDSMVRGALANVCLSNVTRAELDTLGTVKPERYTNTQHYKCFGEQALTERYLGIVKAEYNKHNYCMQDRFGEATSTELETFLETFKTFPVAYHQILKNMVYGWTDLLPKESEDFLETICDSDAATEDLFNLEDSKQCLATPITQTFLTYRPYSDISGIVTSCCSKYAKPLSGSDKGKVKDCLKKNDMYKEFSQLSGLYMRSLKRIVTAYEFECISPAIKAEGATSKFRTGDFTNEELNTYYRGPLQPIYYENTFKLEKMNPVNYQFFLRDFANNDSDDYYKAACEACTAGERLGEQAYSFPGLMCPGLVYDMYYGPNRSQVTCPDKLFYKVQVAHWCCLASAAEKFNYGPSYNPNTCPDMKNVKQTFKDK